MIGSATSNGRVSITGIGANAPERVMKNDELAQIVDTSDEWIVERTGIRERRVATPDEALSDLARPAAEAALEQAGLQASAVDLIVVATVTPDMLFPSTGAILAEQALRRRSHLDVEVRMPETAAQPRYDGLRQK